MRLQESISLLQPPHHRDSTEKPLLGDLWKSIIEARQVHQARGGQAQTLYQWTVPDQEKIVIRIPLRKVSMPRG